MATLILALLIVAVAIPTPAFAYIDPGTGSFVVQGIIAAVVGVGVTLKMFWGRIKAAFTGKSLEENDDTDD